ncbi:MAG: DUF2500 domain-containing protein [Oscillospiraceae bacterium]|nr:DUF2500 domain-containing protein [Oscillospiraceae bacterium]
MSLDYFGGWIGLFAILAVVIGIVVRLLKRVPFVNLPEIQASVKVIAKTTEVSKGASEYIDTFYYISFLFPDGSRHNFNVDINTYNIAVENEMGILTYKKSGNKLMFFKFQPE